jgi:hypothetical protein
VAHRSSASGRSESTAAKSDRLRAILNAAVKDESSGKLVDSQWSFVLASAGVASTISPSLDPTGKKTQCRRHHGLGPIPPAEFETQHYAHFSPAASTISH